MSRKQFTTTIEEDLQKIFKKKCMENNDKMNDVLEAFMESYNKGDFKVKRIVKFELEQI